MSDQNPTPPGDDPIFGEQPSPSNDPVLGGGTPPPPPPPAMPPPAMPPAPPAAAGAGDTVSTAFSWAIAKFQENIGIWIGLAAVVFVLNALSSIISRAVSSSSSTVSGAFAGLGVSLLVGIVFGVLAWLASIGVYRAALRRTQGTAPSLDMLTTGENLGPYIIVAIVFGLATVVGLALCLLPGFIVIFLFMFAPFFALDKGQGVGDAFGNSYRLVTQNVGAVVLVAIVNIVASVLGSLPFTFGLLTLVTLPFSALFTAHAYRTLQHETVAA